MSACAIIQPSYLPWVGTFELISKVDFFIHYDDVQFDKRGWRHRNLIKGTKGLEWITIPVHLPFGSHGTLIKEAEVANLKWAKKHINFLREKYSTAPHLEWTLNWLKPILTTEQKLIVDVTIPLLETCSSKLKIFPKWFKSSDLNVSGDRNLKLIKICQQVGAEKYISGPTAKSYLDVELFNNNGIEVEFFHYSSFFYPQLHGDFQPNVSIIDVFAMLGENSYKLISENNDCANP